MAKKTTTGAENSGELLVYVGPNIVNAKDDILLAFQTFEQIPGFVAGKADLKRLFVPLSRMAEARKELAVKGSRLYNAARAVQTWIATSKKGAN